MAPTTLHRAVRAVRGDGRPRPAKHYSLEFLLGLACCYLFETFLAVGSTATSILSITLRYLHTLV